MIVVVSHEECDRRLKEANEALMAAVKKIATLHDGLREAERERDAALAEVAHMRTVWVEHDL